MEPGNYYEDKSKRQFVNQTKKNSQQKTGQAEERSEKWKDTAKGVGTDLVVGVLGGGLLAAAIGKPALMVGLAISGYGHYAQNKLISALGLGIMASGTMSALNGKAEVPIMSERVRAFGEELKRKLFLDKLLLNKNENLKGTQSPIMKQTTQEPKSADFLQYENPKQESPLHKIPDLKRSQTKNLPDETEDWDFTERIY